MLWDFKGGVAGFKVPKIQALPWWGRGLTHTWIFLKDLSTCTEGPQRWSFITKKWYLPTKVFLIPKNRSFNHIYLTFSLPNMSLLSTTKNVTSRIYALVWAKSLRMPGLGGGGGQPNIGNACILGTLNPATHPLTLIWKAAENGLGKHHNTD